MQAEQLHVFAYDIAEDKRRNQAAETLLNFGERVGLSLFECRVEAQRVEEILSQLQEIIAPRTDRVNLYRLCAYCERANRIAGVTWNSRAALKIL